jgi:proteasome activator subunit 4
MSTNAADHRITTVFPFITKLLPEFFRMQEVLDNDELRGTAQQLVVAVACLPFPGGLTRPLMAQFIGLLKNSPSWRVRLDVLRPLQSTSPSRLSTEDER